jgi:hypothetical protein
MRNIYTVAFAVAAIAAIPAASFAQSGTTPPAGATRTLAECTTDWKNADKNANGKLSPSELSASGAQVPTTLANTPMITQQDFLAACSSTVMNQKK